MRGVLAICATAAVGLAGCAGSNRPIRPAADTRPVTSARKEALPPRPRPVGPAQQVLGLPAIRSRVVPGHVLIADRNNDRIVLVSPDTRRIVWQFPIATAIPGLQQTVVPGRSWTLASGIRTGCRIAPLPNNARWLAHKDSLTALQHVDSIGLHSVSSLPAIDDVAVTVPGIDPIIAGAADDTVAS
jgi:hypothetical protein